jgi:hypothetical protein
MAVFAADTDYPVIARSAQSDYINTFIPTLEGKRIGQRLDSKSSVPKGIVGSNPMPSAYLIFFPVPGTGLYSRTVPVRWGCTVSIRAYFAGTIRTSSALSFRPSVECNSSGLIRLPLALSTNT